MNVLITSASRKVSLVEAFKAALKGEGEVVAADVTQWAAAMHLADQSVLVPPSDSGDFIKSLLAICEERDVQLLIPTRDEELPILAKAIDDFAAVGTRVHVSSLQALTPCLDKKLFHAFCDQHNFNTSTVVTEPTATDLPLFVRPQFGRGSADTYAVRTGSELSELQRMWPSLAEHVVVNHFVDAPEFTIDVFLALDDSAVSGVARERVKVVAGESYIGRTIEDPTLVAESVRLCQMIGLSGHNTVQAFRTTDEIFFIEVNPRFGGGAALGIAAGAPTPQWLLQEVAGQPLDPKPGNYQAGLAMLRYTSDVLVAESELLQ